MLTGARRGEIAGLRWDEIVTEDDGSKAHRAARQRAPKPARPISSRCRARRSASSPNARRRRIVGSKYVLTSDGHQPFANFNRVKDWLDEALERRRRDPPVAIARFSADDRLDAGGEAVPLQPGDARSPARPPAVNAEPGGADLSAEEHLDDRAAALQAWGKHLTQAPATVTKLPSGRRETKAKQRLLQPLKNHAYWHRDNRAYGPPQVDCGRLEAGHRRAGNS